MSIALPGINGNYLHVEPGLGINIPMTQTWAGWFRPATANVNICAWGASASVNPTLPSLAMKFMSTGDVKYRGSSDSASMGIYEANQWRYAYFRRGATTGSLRGGTAPSGGILSGASFNDGAYGATGSTTDTPLGMFEVGRYGTTGYPWNGEVSCFRVWDALLTPDELYLEALSATPVRTANLRANWRFANAADLTSSIDPAGTDGPYTLTVIGAISDGTTEPAEIGTAPTTAPVITDAEDELFFDGESMQFTGTDFGGTQGTGKVYLSPTTDVNHSGRVAQQVLLWTNDTIAVTVTKGSLPFLTGLYLFVVRGDGQVSNAWPVQLEPSVYIRETLVNLDGVPFIGETGLTALVWRSLPSGACVPDQVLVNQSTGSAGNAAWHITRGALVPGDPIWLSIFKDGSPARATMRKIIPSYE